MIKLKKIIFEDYWGSSEQKFWHPGPNYAATIGAYRIKNNKIEFLLIRRKSDTENNKIAFPGGFANTLAQKGKPFTLDIETLEDAAVREFKEETNVDISKNKLKKVGVYNKNNGDPRNNDVAWSVTVLYSIDLTNIDTSNMKGGDDAKSAFWLPLEKIQQISMAFDGNKQVNTILKNIQKITKE